MARKSPRLQLTRYKRILRKHLPELRDQYKVVSLGVFGSYVRGEQRPRSDLDILVDTELPGLLEFIGLQNHLSDLLGVNVDLVPRRGLKPYIGKRILSEVVWVQLDNAPVFLRHRSDLGRQESSRKRSGVMARKREFLDFLDDILRSMDKVERYVAGADFDQFARNEEKVDAVAREIEIIGEATKRIPSDIRRRYPAVPWKDMAGMRDRLVHGYFNVDLDIVWDVATRLIPEVKPTIALALEEEKQRRDAKD